MLYRRTNKHYKIVLLRRGDFTIKSDIESVLDDYEVNVEDQSALVNALEDLLLEEVKSQKIELLDDIKSDIDNTLYDIN